MPVCPSCGSINAAVAAACVSCNEKLAPGRLTSAELRASELQQEIEKLKSGSFAGPPESTESLLVRLQHRNEFFAMLLKREVLWPILGSVIVISFVLAGVATGTFTFTEATNFVVTLGGLMPGNAISAP